MIKQLKLKNYILIDELEANFHSGLNVITGETGAGKSILISAIDLAFSTRVSKEVIKTGSDKAVIELVIDNTKHDLKELFAENGIDYYGSEIILSKEIYFIFYGASIYGAKILAQIYHCGRQTNSGAIPGQAARSSSRTSATRSRRCSR